MTRGTDALEALTRQRPEWSPWLAVVSEARREASTANWDAAVPVEAPMDLGVPRLAGATVVVDPAVVARFTERLVDIAARGTASMGAFKAPLRAADPLAVFQASILRDPAGEPEPVHAVVALVAVPFLRACQRRWASATFEAWPHGYCPICALWPAFGEVRGIERRRYLRCGGCGGEWNAQPLQCHYCGNQDHHELRTLVPEDARRAGAVEACRSCRGYTKVFTRLQGGSPDNVIVEDLASVDLDVAALEQGYRRQSGLGCALDLAFSHGTHEPRRRESVRPAAC